MLGPTLCFSSITEMVYLRHKHTGISSTVDSLSVCLGDTFWCVSMNTAAVLQQLDCLGFTAFGLQNRTSRTNVNLRGILYIYTWKMNEWTHFVPPLSIGMNQAASKKNQSMGHIMLAQGPDLSKSLLIQYHIWKWLSARCCMKSVVYIQSILQVYRFNAKQFSRKACVPRRYD